MREALCPAGSIEVGVSSPEDLEISLLESTLFTLIADEERSDDAVEVLGRGREISDEEDLGR